MAELPSGVLILIYLIGALYQGACNTFPPKFEGLPQHLFISENEPAGTLITYVNVSYSGDDNNLVFDILGEIAKSIVKLEATNSNKVKALKTATPLDRELIAQYSLILSVEDGENVPVTRYTTLFVNDVNDNHPTFINLPYRAEIQEDASVDTSVYKVEATDPDSGRWGNVYYDIIDNDQTPQGLFKIDRIDGTVTLENAIDYEKEKFYQLEITAVDGGNLSSTTDLVINILDVQDTAPFFQNLPYMADVYENITVGTPILQVSAMDGDRGVPNPVTYSFHSGYHKFFHINASTGVISVREPLDREDPLVLELFGVLTLEVLTEEVTSTPQGPTEATAPVTIRIKDVNDQAPTFSQTEYTASIMENTQNRIPVSFLPETTEMTVWDMDEGDNGKFALRVEQDGLPFDVFEVFPTDVLNEANLAIRVKNSSALDYEKVKKFTFNVVAQEYLTAEKRENMTRVTVYLEDVNDNWPAFEQEIYNATIKENSPKATYVTTINATDRDTGLFGTLKYQLKGASSSLFRITESQGHVYVNVAAERDHSLLDREKQETHYLTFEAVDGGGLRTSVALEIHLSDENDNAPEIVRSEYEGYVRENAGALDRPLVIEAVDRDLPPNDQIHFFIIQGNPMANFTIGSESGEIKLSGPLDYEAMDPQMNGTYILTVMAEDLGNLPLNSTVTVKINVQDENDKAPQFEKNFYQTTILENSIGGFHVTSVHATDDDITAPNNEVIYRLDSGGLDKFRINAQTGDITVESGADLDRDAYATEYTLKILAIDRGTPPLTGETVVQVNITDVNNKFPEFEPEQKSTRILENITVGSNFFTYQAVDLDLNHNLRYRLMDDTIYGEDEDKAPHPDADYLQSLFGIHAHNGTLFVKNALDRETVELIVVQIFVEDTNAEEPPVQNATATLSITLRDVNDNPPEWIPTDFYTATVSEGSSPGVEVKQVTSIDRDLNVQPIRYYLIEDKPQSEFFNITQTTGIVTLRQSVDHEEYQLINITVMAIDGGDPVLSSTAVVKIEVIDVNDNSPEWEMFQENVYVWENDTIGTLVTRVFATDRDSGEFGRVMYYITQGHFDHFQMDNQTGQMTTVDTLDREKIATYNLFIDARDNNFAPENEQRINTRSMRIHLQDINDNAPQFDEPTYQVEIKENLDVNDAVIKVTATDQDEGVNAEIVYSIDPSPVNATNLFTVHPTSGQLYVKTPLKGNIGWFFVTVRATDKGQEPLSNTTVVHVFIEDVNDHPPHITYPTEADRITVNEHEALGHVIVQVLAVDGDSGLNGVVEFEFVTAGSNDYIYFNISRKTGVITVAKDIDRETQEVYRLQVRAYDLGTPQMDDTESFTVIALDENDHPPAFDREKFPPPHRISVLEEQGNIYVANLSLAEDPDVGNNSVICYYIVGGDAVHKSAFHMNKSSGELWLGQKLDREAVQEVELIVKATHDCFSGHWENEENTDQPWNASDSSLLLVKVEILDINDNPPKFLKTWFTAGVTKDTQPGTQVIDLSLYATDPDIGNNSLLSFYVEGDFDYTDGLRDKVKDDPFLVEQMSGIVKTNEYFSSDMTGHIMFKVKVTDIDPLHQDIGEVSVYLLNEDQRVKVIIRGEPHEVYEFRDHFADFLSNITGLIINVDEILPHKDDSEQSDTRMTDMFIHGINKNGEVVSADYLIQQMDKNYIHLEDLFKKYNILEVVPAVETVAESRVDKTILFGVIAVAVVLAVLIIVICATAWTCRKKYKRKLKAATAMAFGSHDTGLNQLHGVPGTNKHSYEGSNPIWLEQYESGWPRETDTDSRNSLDENKVSPDNDTSDKAYDEQEMSMEMQNDEFDQYHRYNGGSNQANRNQDRDKYLRAALEAQQKEPVAIKEQNNVPNEGTPGYMGNHLGGSPTLSDNGERNSKLHLTQNGKSPPAPPQIPNGVGKMGSGSTGTNRNGFASIGRHSKLNTAADTGRRHSGESHRNISIVGKPSILDSSLYDNRGFDMQATEI